MIKLCFKLCIIFLFLTPMSLLAQPGFDDDTSDVPIDGGLSLLITAGIGYGLKKQQMRKNKKYEKKV